VETTAKVRRSSHVSTRARAHTHAHALAHVSQPTDREQRGRRLLNVVIAALGLVLALPVMLVIAALIKLTSRGPVLFAQQRVGLDRRALSRSGGNSRRRMDLGGAQFTMYKFRKFRLDELPQVLNVLRGEMNIVGPRPEQPAIFVYLREQIEGYQRRQRVRPGITGWAQVNQGYDTSVDDVRRKVRYDLEYIHGQSTLEDLRIMLRTVPVMLFRRGAH